jgi:hypothetical protein
MRSTVWRYYAKRWAGDLVNHISLDRSSQKVGVSARSLTITGIWPKSVNGSFSPAKSIQLDHPEAGSRGRRATLHKSRSNCES